MVRFILASSSPRRKYLLSLIGVRARVVSPDVDESARRGESPRRMVARLARDKAESIAARMGTGRCLILAADTIVVAPGGKRILGKPRNRRDAEQMLRVLAGRTHVVYTAYCVIELESGRVHRRVVRVVSSRVTMRRLSAQQIRDYVTTGEPMDKAGSYAAQGIGMALIAKINGSYTNVVGLPMSELIEDLERKFSCKIKIRKP